MGIAAAFVSGKGGTGKTSLCAAVASCLAAEGSRVLCVDLDVGLRNLDLALGMREEPLLPFTDVMSGEYRLDQIPPFAPLRELHLLSAPVTLAPEDVDPQAFSRFLDDCRAAFDWILLDAPAGIGAGFRLTAAADEIVLVTGADSAAMRDGRAAAERLKALTDVPARVIVNRVSPRMLRRMAETVDDIMDAVGLPLLGIVPEDPRVTLAAARNTPLVLAAQKGAAAACLRIARRLKGVRTPIRAK